ncbi:MAG: hydrogenase maturation nickel metallochaperone HypA [Coriobacteriia bacterium]
MHELPILRDVVDIAIAHASEAGASRIVSIKLEIGELRDLDQEWMQRYFDFVTKDTIAEGASLVVTYSAARFMCNSCRESFTFEIRSQNQLRCPRCSSAQAELVAGNELRIESIDVS